MAGNLTYSRAIYDAELQLAEFFAARPELPGRTPEQRAAKLAALRDVAQDEAKGHQEDR